MRHSNITRQARTLEDGATEASASDGTGPDAGQDRGDALGASSSE